ncbi:hypothetical protein HYW76_02320 [Candidatus Pacearchaeota archaeon]|nr:hypothetical protein [Candidatus Pacearchaeota archaeon]
MSDTILSSDIVVNAILPFLLVFTLIFAILQKTKILGEGKKQIDAIIALVVGLMLIAFPYPRGIIVNLMPLLAVIAVVLLVFLVLLQFAYNDKDFSMPGGLKKGLGVLVGVAIVIALVYFTGAWDFISNQSAAGNNLFRNAIFIIIIIAGIALVLFSGKGEGK